MVQEKRYHFVTADAERKAVLLRAGLCGPTGSGKTKTGLILGSRMVEQLDIGPLYVIDSESRSSLRYAYSPRSREGYRFKHVPMPEDDYSPAAYLAALEHCESEGAGVIIIDSLSHVWAGINGVLELVDQVTEKSRSRNAFSEGWKTMTPIYNRLVQRLLGSSAHVIFTLRAKTEWVIEENERGKREPKKVGMGAVMRDNFDYEPDFWGDLTAPDNSMLVSKSRLDRVAQGELIKRPGVEFADVVCEWLKDAAPAAGARTLGEAIVFAVTEGIQAAAAASPERYKVARKGLAEWCDSHGLLQARRDEALQRFKERVAAVTGGKDRNQGASVTGGAPSSDRAPGATQPEALSAAPAPMTDAERLRAIDEGRA